MRKWLFGLFVLPLIVLSSCNLTQRSSEDSQLENISNIESSSTKVSEESIKNSMNYLASDELRGRETGTEGIEKAAQFVENIFQENNLKPFFKTYRDSFEVKGKTGYNLVGLLEGNDPQLKNEYIIVGAHYDHIGLGKVVDGDSIANGANDNAAGTVAVHELAKLLSNQENKRSILFTLFSAEEMGLEGAKKLAKRLKAEKLDLYAMLNLEMIGVPMEGKDYQAYLTGFENSNFAQKFNDYTGEKTLGFLPQAKQYNLFQRSDNYPFFLEFNVPAQTISTFDFTNYDYYHHVSDEAEEMDYAHMANLIEAVAPGINKMANTPEREIKLN